MLLITTSPAPQLQTMGAAKSQRSAPHMASARLSPAAWGTGSGPGPSAASSLSAPELKAQTVNFRLQCRGFTATLWELLALNLILYNHTSLILW